MRDHIDRPFWLWAALTRQRAIGSRQTARLEFVVRTPTIVRDLMTSSKLEESLPILPIEGVYARLYRNG